MISVCGGEAYRGVIPPLRREGTVMTPIEFKEEMQQLIDNDIEYDTEAAHRAADALMCRALRDLGFGEGVDIYDGMDKWYA